MKKNPDEGRQSLGCIRTQLALDLVPPSFWHSTCFQELVYKIRLEDEGRAGLSEQSRAKK